MVPSANPFFVRVCYRTMRGSGGNTKADFMRQLGILINTGSGWRGWVDVLPFVFQNSALRGWVDIWAPPSTNHPTNQTPHQQAAPPAHGTC